jgi:hypothetical protein
METAAVLPTVGLLAAAEARDVREPCAEYARENGLAHVTGGFSQTL